MTKRMLVDATHPEETRVAIVNSYRDTNRLDDLDFGLASKPILRGNIYLAKVMRIEPSLQAAFVEYGGNRHGFLPFSEIHPDYFRIPVADRPHDEDQPLEAVPEEEDEESPGNDEIDLEAIPESFTHAPEETVPDTELEIVADEAENGGDETPPVTDQPGPDLFDMASTHEGLITDFGNALIPPPSLADAPPPTPVESVGGDLAERVVRRHRPRYKIQEVLKRGQIMLIQVVKEERGNKGAALTTFLSLAGRYCVLMPNTGHGGGVSRKITNHQDRRRMKEILDQLEIPEGMAVILRTAGMEQEPQEIQRDLEYLLRLWDSIREQTLVSNAPALIYEEANLIKRSVRDLYTQDIDEILVAGAEGFNRAREFMAALMPDQIDKIKLYNDPIPLFFRYHVENQIDKLHSPIVQLRSGGYLVINPTEALVAIDVNSGRATRERHIEETALKTNLEAADEIARQLRLRDLAGLIVIDFIDMEDGRNNAAVERRLKEAMKNDRARLQIGRISPFGLLELSRQRLRPSLLEINFEKCPHCTGLGYVRSVDSAALSVLRAIEEEGIRQNGVDLTLSLSSRVALYILNQKRAALREIEERYDLHVILNGDDSFVPPDYKLERIRTQRAGNRKGAPAVDADQVLADTERALYAQPPQDVSPDDPETGDPDAQPVSFDNQNTAQDKDHRRRRFRRGGRGAAGRHDRAGSRPPAAAPTPEPFGTEGDLVESGPSVAAADDNAAESPDAFGRNRDFNADDQDNLQPRRRRRGRRGGRHRGNGSGGGSREYRGSPDSRRDSRKHYGNAPQPGFEPLNGPNAEFERVPTSIHELDTTPRLERPSPPPPPVTSNPTASSPPAQEKPATSSYEVVNPPSATPKGGWWRRLTGV